MQRFFQLIEHSILKLAPLDQVNYFLLLKVYFTNC